MANHKEHRNKGIGYSLYAELILLSSSKKSIAELNIEDGINISIYTAGSAFGSLFPDKIEPATHPYHRSIFHSLMMLGALIHGYLLLLKPDVLKDSLKLKSFLRGFIFGYITHLGLDMRTSFSLPFVV